jgi:hypothetical protein
MRLITIIKTYKESGTTEGQEEGRFLISTRYRKWKNEKWMRNHHLGFGWNSQREQSGLDGITILLNTRLTKPPGDVELHLGNYDCL